MASPPQTCSPLRLSSLPTAIGVRGIQRTTLSCPGLRMASPPQTCSPLRLSSLPTAIWRPGYSADDTFIPRTPDLRRAKISASFLLWFAYGEATTPASCYACRRPFPGHRETAAGLSLGHRVTAAGLSLGRHETAAGRPLSTMRRPQGFLSGRLSGVGAKEPLWLPIGDQGRLVSAPSGCRLVIRGGLCQNPCV